MKTKQSSDSSSIFGYSLGVSAVGVYIIMATVSCTQCVCALLLTIVLTWLPGEAVYFESAYTTSQKQDRSRNSGSSERQRRGRERSRDNDDDDSPALGRSERRRDPFQRTIVSS